MSESSPSETPSRRLAVRFALTLVSLALVSLMNRALGAAIEQYSETFAIPGGLVAAYVLFGVLAGVAFGLAAMLPRRIPAFHWRRALTLAFLPALIVALNIVAFTSPTTLPGWVQQLDFLLGLQTATVGAVLAGVAVSAAVAEA